MEIVYLLYKREEEGKKNLTSRYFINIFIHLPCTFFGGGEERSVRAIFSVVVVVFSFPISRIIGLLVLITGLMVGGRFSASGISITWWGPAHHQTPVRQQQRIPSRCPHRCIHLKINKASLPMQMPMQLYRECGFPMKRTLAYVPFSIIIQMYRGFVLLLPRSASATDFCAALRSATARDRRRRRRKVFPSSLEIRF